MVPSSPGLEERLYDALLAEADHLHQRLQDQPTLSIVVTAHLDGGERLTLAVPTADLARLANERRVLLASHHAKASRPAPAPANPHAILPIAEGDRLGARHDR